MKQKRCLIQNVNFSIKGRKPPDWLLDRLTLNHLFFALVVIVPGLIMAVAWPRKPAVGFVGHKNSATEANRREPIQPIPLSIKLDQRKVALGEKLFNDKRLSRDGTVSCATCHDLKKGGTDHKMHSLGMDGKKGSINAPTVFNALFNFRQFWDGRAADLEEQVNGPISNPAEMAGSWKKIIEYLRQDAEYRTDFLEVYGQEPAAPFVRNAIAEFERSLFTPNSRFDRYLMGDSGAITKKELAGYVLFKRNGCIACHQGRNVGGNMYQSFGVLGNYFKDRKRALTAADLGRFNVTKRERDRHVFKVPSLRNVALTGPYFHDGSAKTLGEAVRIMGRYQLGRRLAPTEIELIVAFLKTLTGEYKGKPL